MIKRIVRKWLGIEEQQDSINRILSRQESDWKHWAEGKENLEKAIGYKGKGFAGRGESLIDDFALMVMAIVDYLGIEFEEEMVDDTSMPPRPPYPKKMVLVARKKKKGTHNEEG